MLDPLREAFYTRQLLNPLSGGQVALWHALAYTREKAHKKEWFTIAGMTLVQLSGLSLAGIKKARNELKQHGLIDFRTNGTRSTSYKLVDISESSQDSSRNGSQDSSRNGSQDSSRNGSAIYNNTNNIDVVRARPLMTDEEMDEAAALSSHNRDALITAMEESGIKVTSRTIDTMEAMAAEHGIDSVMSAISKAVEHDKKGGISVAYVRSILENSGRKEERSPQPTDEQLAKKRREEAATLALLRGELPD